MRIALALAVSLAPALSAAKCAHAYLGSLPAHDTPLPANGLVWLEAFGADQPVVAALEGGAKAWLEGAGGRVPLTAKFVNVGSFNLTQTVLQPSKPLKEGQTYALVLTRDGKAFRPTERVDGKDVPTTWKVGPADEAPPVWTGAPVITERTHVEYGCGPAIEVAVKVPVEGGVCHRGDAAGAQGHVELVAAGGVGWQHSHRPWHVFGGVRCVGGGGAGGHAGGGGCGGQSCAGPRGASVCGGGVQRRGVILGASGVSLELFRPRARRPTMADGVGGA
jgi:hypothetical protein